MTDTYNRAVSLILVMLKGETNPNSETIQKKVDLVLGMLKAEGDSDPVNRDRLIKDIESRCEIWRGSATVLENKKDHKVWLPDKKSQIPWKFWKRYERYLMEEKGFSEQNIITLDNLTDGVLERLEDPVREDSWDRRGMVVGYVQSGKTANYTGLICKTADAGYKLIIVLAGMHKSLRSQTQVRLDEGFLGFDTQLNRAFNQENLRIGVGSLPGEEFITVHSLTSSADNGDFNRRVASQVGVLPGGKDPVILVVKKQISVLNNLINWAISVRGQEDPSTGKKIVRNIPLLVIDDEADNASVNTNPIPLDEDGKPLDDYDVSKTNDKIRTLLGHFKKSAYVGYTATPFANIFIFPEGETKTHGEDLFPRDFIINLPKPPNYIGPSEIFGFSHDDEDQEGLDIIRKIYDSEQFIPNNHKKDFKPKNLPESLKTAIKSFIITCAARRVRGEYRNHNSMLIHVTRYTAVQKELGELVNEELSFVRRQLEYSDPSDPDKIYSEFKKIWNSDYIPTTDSVRKQINDPLISDVSWEELSPYLYDSAARIRIKQINGTAKDVLDYNDQPDGLNVIAIGGDKLSRGLTLEGLSISYYLRASRMYDTLMQMGRWFGFRPGYIDLCRLYTSPELVEWYQYINMASEELRSEFDYMAILNSTPREYGLRVRTHPDGLLITAVNKMRTGTVMQLSYSNSLIETYKLYKDTEKLRNNLNVTNQFIQNLGIPNGSSVFFEQHKIWKNVPAIDILKILDEYLIHEDLKKANPRYLKEYIRKQLLKGELTHWTVALINNSQAKNTAVIGSCEIGLTVRKPDLNLSNSKYVLRKGHIIDPKHEYIDFTEIQFEEALQKMKNDPNRRTRSEEEPQFPSGQYIRDTRPPEQGLLLIYPLDPNPPKVEIPVIGLAFSIPKSNNDVKIEYKVNNIYWEQEFDS
ncbi:Putative endonuclease, Z1 domain protein [Methanolacinia petrolearia DSM 11571]|uniref:Putative endonuclease, Z1 domain protein n=1 Tax=Methanolacinia petrolearia (strain DSM 11571 / OCM 486 / SEBR 4847) TaxID=679926 RepID=E1RKA0_METP4|nr:Z1 domain-containing protein [Methanolacinia petrolearia]ADN36913.1 Putative endonuclease, Z1 domain protein [Methanolacinia petrolearia DSM 11571]